MVGLNCSHPCLQFAHISTMIDSPQLVDVVNTRYPQTFLNQLDSDSQYLEGLGMGGNSK